MITILKLSRCFLYTHKFDDVSSVPPYNFTCGTAEECLKRYVWVVSSEVYQLQE